MKIRLLLYIFCLIGCLSIVFCSRSKRSSAHDAPDYSLVVTDNIQRFVYVIAFIDRITAEIYHNDPETIKTAIGRAFKTANTYFYQINLRLIVADIILTGREFSTLQDSNEYHNDLRKKRTLPYHNFAIFFNSKIKYNLAWPGQLCRPYNGIHIPLNHYNPDESGPEIFEIFAFLTNLSKKEETEGLENCRCKTYFSRTQRSTPKHDCLRIPGYPQNCSVQALADKLKTIECLPKRIRIADDDAKEGYLKDGNERSLSGIAVCGNGIIEEGEICDCGFKRYCLNEKHQKHCNQTSCLWNGQHAFPRLSYSDEKNSICVCNFIKKVLNERCGKELCQLDYPIWAIHGVMYSITALLILLFCCAFSCCYGRNPSKVYRQSIIFTFDEKPKHKSPPPPPPASTKPRPVIVVMRPSIPPPAPPTLPKPKLLRPSFMSQQLPLPPKQKFCKKENPYDKVPMSSPS